MRQRRTLAVHNSGSTLLIAGFVRLAGQETGAWTDPSPHRISFVTVDKDVRLEVLDWGGSGRPLVLLTGLGNNAHVFDNFAPKLTPDYHVIAITRRGYGASTIAPSGYEANRLGDDVLAVLNSLNLQSPLLVGHSIAGEELSWVGSRHPDRVAGLVYLDAAYEYAFDNGKGTSRAELNELERTIPAPPPPSDSDLASYRALQDWWARVRGFRMPEADFRQGRWTNSDGTPGERRTPLKIPQMVLDGTAKFSKIDVSVLALCAMPQVTPRYLRDSPNPDVRTAAQAYDARFKVAKEKQLRSFEEGIPHARVVRIPNADHYIFITNEAEVLREMRTFLSTLK
jgi:pimeloyl-ACP methyl ester carboxylesterase